MSTAIAIPFIDPWQNTDRGRHTKVTLRHTWVCTQVNCNGVNHVWRTVQ